LLAAGPGALRSKKLKVLKDMDFKFEI
jgi:hypothetical protein